MKHNFCKKNSKNFNFTLWFGQVDWALKVPFRTAACAGVAGCVFGEEAQTKLKTSLMDFNFTLR